MAAREKPADGQWTIMPGELTGKVVPLRPPSADRTEAQRHVELLTGSADTAIRVRLFPDDGKKLGAVKLDGTVAELWPEITRYQAQGYGAFIVVNEGGDTDAEITAIRAVFVDGDAIPRPDAWHAEPDILTVRDATHWHAYWLVGDMDVTEFRAAQKRLVAHYGSDPKVCNPSRVMRLAGTLHHKGAPILIRLDDRDGGLRSRTAAALLTGLPNVATQAARVAPAKVELDGTARVAPANVELDRPARLAAAKEYVAGRIERGDVAIEGRGGDTRTYRLGARMGDLGVSLEAAVEFCSRWNAACLPPWEWDEFEAKLAQGYRSRQNEIGCDAPQSGAEAFGEVARKLGFTSERATSDRWPLTAAELADGNFPRADYAWANFILRRRVNLLYGDGGTGKSLLALHMAVAMAAGRPLFGLDTVQMPALLLCVEDDYGETKARLEAICEKLGVSLADLPLHLWCEPPWETNIAHVRDDGTWEPGAFLDSLRATLARIGPCFLVLDTVSDIAALDEIKRLPVNTLCKGVLGGLCRDYGATVLVNAHPSKASLADGSHYSGGTAWNNAVRNRLTLMRPDGDENSHQRTLKVAKANYGGNGELELFLVGQTFVLPNEIGRTDLEEREAVLSVTLDLIDRDISVVRGNGTGQKPADVARAVRDRFGFELRPKQVLAHLNALERMSKLRYQPGGNQQRGQRAGFGRPTAT